MVPTVSIANCDVHRIACQKLSEEQWECRLTVASGNSQQHELIGIANDLCGAVCAALNQICRFPLAIQQTESVALDDGQHQTAVWVSKVDDCRLSGVGRSVHPMYETSLVIATLRAINHAGFLKHTYRANNQKALRNFADEIVCQLQQSLHLSEPLSERQRLDAEGILLDYLNRAASAAVVIAENSPVPESNLNLFDTSAWIIDHQGRQRSSYTDTSFWLAWYPGIDNDDHTISEVLASMPAAPATEIPWIVRLFENPTSWLRFRGAVDLEDHDIMHVLLGRGLQDQDEAFVLGFAMGTAKKFSRVEYYIFRIMLSRVYPEPYRVPSYLLPAFDIGLMCGQQNRVRDLYKRSLKELRELSLGEARKITGIDTKLLRDYFKQEQEQIPHTIASLRLG